METNIDRELLIRIDERQKAMTDSLARIELTMTSKVDNNQDYKDLVNKVTAMWDLKNKTMGIIAAWSAIIAIASAVIIEYLKGLLFNK